MVRRHVENIKTKKKSSCQRGMEILFKEHALRSNVVLYILGKALLLWSLLEALCKLMLTAKYHKSTSKWTKSLFVSPAVLVIIKANIKSVYMNWTVQGRLGGEHVRESRIKQSPVVSPPSTSLDRVLFSLGILSNFIFSWLWLGQFP